jgi:ABC-type nitrate/sulfonate/bicarbonate transport system substrate-binding protein
VRALASVGPILITATNGVKYEKSDPSPRGIRRWGFPAHVSSRHGPKLTPWNLSRRGRLVKPTFVSGATLQPVKSGTLKIPTITWGGDVPTVLTDSEGLFKAEGLTTSLFHEDDFAKQVRGVLDGTTPFLRGTFGMINSASETFHKAGTDLVVLNQLTWSRGGDVLVVRPGKDGTEIKSLGDLKGKTIALQLYGPHMDLLTTVLNRAGLKISDVKIVWFKELTIPSYDTRGKLIDARSAFAADPSIDAAFVISPDAAALTSNGAATGGTGSEGSVKGAKVLFSTKSADHVIADVYAVRADWYAKHKSEAEKFCPRSHGRSGALQHACGQQDQREEEI